MIFVPKSLFYFSQKTKLKKIRKRELTFSQKPKKYPPQNPQLALHNNNSTPGQVLQYGIYCL